MSMNIENYAVTRKRILTVAACVFFLLVGGATTTRQHVWKSHLEGVDRDIQRLEERRIALTQTVADLERRCEDLKSRIIEQENAKGDQDEE